MAAEEAGAARLAAGLLCLERQIPDQVLRGLEELADNATPFKVEVLRPGRRQGDSDGAAKEGEGWLDKLAAGIGSSSSSSNADGRDNAGEERRSENLARRVQGATLQHGENLLHPKLPRLQQQLDVEAQAAVSWLKADIKRVARIFAREISVLSDEPGETAVLDSATEPLARKDESAVDMTVKLELLKRGKCPRFHLDKVKKRARFAPGVNDVVGFDGIRNASKSEVWAPYCYACRETIMEALGGGRFGVLGVSSGYLDIFYSLIPAPPQMQS